MKIYPKMKIVYPSDMEKEFTNTELFALAVAARTMAKLYEINGEKTDVITVMRSAAAKMDAYVKQTLSQNATIED